MRLDTPRRARWAGVGDRSRPLAVAALVFLGGLVPAVPVLAKTCEGAAVARGTALLQLTAVTVQRQDEAVIVRLHTGRTPTYAAMVLDAPPRIVIDLDAARYAWCGPLTVNPEPIRQVRGSQWKPGTARVVVELSRPVGYSIEERPDGLLLRLTSVGEHPAVESAPSPTTGESARVAQGTSSPVSEGEAAESAQASSSAAAEGPPALALRGSAPFRTSRPDVRMKGHVA